MSDAEGKDNPQSKRPLDNDFQQQRLRAWQPLLTPPWVIGVFSVVGIIFIIIGGICLHASRQVVDVESREYTEKEGNQLTITLPISKKMKTPVYFYYGLDNFYQNHRRYVKSRSDTQLRNKGGDTSSCEPLERDANGTKLYPCGLIAQSFFTDRYNAEWCNSEHSCELLPETSQSWHTRGIAWESDVDHKFEFREPRDDETSVGVHGFDFKNILMDPDRKEEFIVWMRTAGLPRFKKLHRIIASLESPGAKMGRDYFAPGDYLRINVTNTYPVSSFGGKKFVVLSTTTWLGGRNDFLGIAYLVVGSLCFVLALAFFAKHKISPRPLGDLSYFNWPSVKASA